MFEHITKQKKYLMKIKSSSYKHSLIPRKGAGRSYYVGPFACYLVYMLICFWIRFQNDFPYLPILESKHYSLIKKTLFDLRLFCNGFLRWIYLTTNARLQQITFQSAKIILFSFCMLETITTLLSLLEINSINNFSSNTPKM